MFWWWPYGLRSLVIIFAESLTQKSFILLMIDIFIIPVISNSLSSGRLIFQSKQCNTVHISVTSLSHFYHCVSTVSISCILRSSMSFLEGLS